jgi:lysine-ketoglutarate reductase/saccharopine dehydrogenase-like protein (TIGR00300 family)
MVSYRYSEVRDTMGKPEKNGFHEVVELRGHIIDSLTLSKIFDEIIARGGAYLSEEIKIGETKDDPSYARIRVEAPEKSTLDNILTRLSELGAVSIENRELLTKESPKDGVFPDGFYSTTNLETEVFLNGGWIPVEDISMDSAILVDTSDANNPVASAVKMKDVKQGDSIVVGSAGVRVSLPERTQVHGAFEFMTSGVSSEKPMTTLIGSVAEEIKALRKEKGAKILFVCGPAIVHTGARDALSDLIEKGYVDILFAGNALAAHDIEASIYGTSLGVSLAEGVNVFEGHNHHLRAINSVRRAGSIKEAVEKGIIKDGIMSTCVKKNIDFLLAGSIRDDGPLPDVITDMLTAQTMMREKLKGVKMAIMVSTMLHSIAVGNLLPASVRTICVDINQATITKLADRGTHQATGLVLDAGTFLRELSARLP